MTNIFVGKLDFDTTEDALRQLFAAYGAVDRVTLIRDRDTGQAAQVRLRGESARRMVDLLGI